MSNRGYQAVALVLLVLAAPRALAYDETQSDEYVASPGVNVLGIGAATNMGPLGPGRYWAAESVTHVDVRVVDDTGARPWITVCVDSNNNNLCATSDGDVQVSGVGAVSVTLPVSQAFRQVQVYAYALNVPGAAVPNVATTGTVFLHFSA